MAFFETKWIIEMYNFFLLTYRFLLDFQPIDVCAAFLEAIDQSKSGRNILNRIIAIISKWF